ncbi:AaceriACL203Cp [[Ashbya] aceris (nom. inval.)]|nr:AaceriACL203Cp [[Ashbya] aceris (nom. inval.)]
MEARESKEAFLKNEVESSDAELGSSHGENPFADPVVADYYRKLYQEADYECRNAFDPEFQWSKEEEKQLVRRLDYKVTFSACILFCAMQIDRNNLYQATSDDMLQELDVTTNDYNLGNQLFNVFHLLGTVPVQLLAKRYGIERVVPCQMILWSFVAMAQAGMSNKAGFVTVRVLLGLCEAGFATIMVTWLTCFYTAKELGMRISCFWIAQGLMNVVTPLAAYGIFRMRGICGLSGWQWLFLLEGAITCIMGILGFFLLVPSLVETKNFLHPKGWFTERQELIAVNRLLRDDPSKGDMNNKTGLSTKLFIEALLDYDLWPLYLLAAVHFFAEAAAGPYLLITLKDVGFSTFTVQLLAIPNSVSNTIAILVMLKIYEVVDERSLLSLFPCIWKVVLVGCLRWWDGAFEKAWETYALMIVLLACPYIFPMMFSWASRNSNSIRTRSVSTAVLQVFNVVGFVCGNQLYRMDDAPLYHRGNTILFCLMLANIPLFIGVKLYYMWRNKKRDLIWNAMTEKERLSYIENTTDKGNKRLDFRFAH